MNTSAQVIHDFNLQMQHNAELIRLQSDTIKAQQVEIETLKGLLQRWQTNLNNTDYYTERQLMKETDEALKVKAGNMSQDKERDIINRDERIFELQTENEALMRWLKRWQTISANIITIEGGFRPLYELKAATKAVLGE